MICELTRVAQCPVSNIVELSYNVTASNCVNMNLRKMNVSWHLSDVFVCLFLRSKTLVGNNVQRYSLKLWINQKNKQAVFLILHETKNKGEHTQVWYLRVLRGWRRKKERKKAAVQITGYVTDLVFNNSQYLISTECCQNSIAWSFQWIIVFNTASTFSCKENLFPIQWW